MTNREALDLYERVRYNLTHPRHKEAVDVAFAALVQETVTNRNGFNRIEPDTVKVVDSDRFKAGWVSVDDGMPCDNEKVLVHTRSGKMCVARWSVRQNKFMASGNLTVTHWMKMPDAPKKGDTSGFAENGLDGDRP